MKTCSKYLDALEKIAFLKQSLIDEINLDSIHHTKDFLKTMEQVREHTVAPLKALCYWETEIKRQLLRWIENLLSKTIVASSLAMDATCLETSNRFQFFQLKTIHALPSQVQSSARSEPNACTKPVLT